MEPEVKYQILPIPTEEPQVVFDLTTPPENMANESRRDNQPSQCLMEAMQLELI